MSDASQLYNDTCKMIRSVLLPNKYGLFLCNLEREYRGLLGESLQWKRLGFHSLKDMIMKIPEVVTVERVGDGQLLLHATPDSSTQHIANMGGLTRSQTPLSFSCAPPESGVPSS